MSHAAHLPRPHHLLVIAVVLIAPMKWAHQALSQPVIIPTAMHASNASDESPSVQANLPSNETKTEIANPAPSSSAADSAAQKIIGTWEQERYGRRLLTLLPEGKARMVIEPAGRWSFIFGKRIEIEMYWSIKDDRIRYGMTSGTPADKYALAVASWGDHWDEALTKLTDTELIVAADDGVISEWKRVVMSP